MTWQSYANCNAEHHDLFFSQSKTKMNMAVQICNPCPVKGECLKFAIDQNIEYGIYGGLTPTQRKDMANV